jgi:riboflavin kinase / FMN adenylyltransferase
MELGGRWLRVEPLRLLRRQQRFDGLEALRPRSPADADQALCRALAGVGVGEAPDDEGADAAQQQNS